MTKKELERQLAKAPTLSNNQFTVLDLKVEAITQYLMELPLEGSLYEEPLAEAAPVMEEEAAEGEPQPPYEEPPPEEAEEPEPVVEEGPAEEQPDYGPPEDPGVPPSYGSFPPEGQGEGGSR